MTDKTIQATSRGRVVPCNGRQVPLGYGHGELHFLELLEKPTVSVVFQVQNFSIACRLQVDNWTSLHFRRKSESSLLSHFSNTYNTSNTSLDGNYTR